MIEQISDAVWIEQLANGSWMICLDASVIEEAPSYRQAKARAIEIDRTRTCITD